MTEFKPKGRHPKQILNEIKWRGQDLEKCEIDILHRGAPKDTIRLKGSDIHLGRSFFSYGGSEIPYHRILCIRLEGKMVFERK
ncbi:MAG: DUF504 domain-containing protein [Methanotrichaceae archaeon]